MRELIKNVIKNKKAEPYIRWLMKRSRGIKIPFDLVKNEIYDRQAMEIIEKVLSTNSNTIDIGCHEGQFLEFFLAHAPNGRHFAFEPIPHFAKKLEDTYPSARVYNYALSNSSGEETFYIIPESPALSGLNARTFLAQDKIRMEVNVKTERLDSIIPQDLKIDLIKIDVEGAEGLVIEGAINTIKKNKPYIILEHGEASSMVFGRSSGDVYDLLVNDGGLKISLLDDWIIGNPTLSRHEFIASSNWYFLAHPVN